MYDTKQCNNIEYNNRNCCNNDSYNHDHPILPKSRKISTVSGYDVQRLIFKIQHAQSFIPSIQSIPILDYRNSKINISNSNDNEPPKHIGQIESIITHMYQNGMLPKHDGNNNTNSNRHTDSEKDNDNDYCFVEFGCGTAKLSDYISMYMEHQQLSSSTIRKCQYILIDQQPMKAVERYCDGRIRARTLSSSITTTTTTIELNGISDVVQRLICPISQVQLYNVLNPSNKMIVDNGCQKNVNVIAIAKHLCGSATDDAIQCIKNYNHHCIICQQDIDCGNDNNTGSEATSAPSMNMCIESDIPSTSLWMNSNIPLVIATCCHYACNINTFISKNSSTKSTLSYLQYLGFDERDIEVLIIVSQWASIKIDIETDGEEKTNSISSSLFHHDRNSLSDKNDRNTFPPPLPPHPIPMNDIPNYNIELMSSEMFEQTFTRNNKYELGQYSKLLLDTARAYYLKNNCNYTHVQLIYYTTLSIERNLLIATM